MVLKFYYDLLSQPCRAIYIFLKLNNIPFEDNALSLMSGDSNKGAFSKLTTMKRVPLIDDDGFVLSESVAILKYLARKYNVPGHWYPAESVTDQARVDEYMSWQHTALRLQEMKYFMNLYLIPHLTGNPIKWDEVDTYKEGVTKAVNELENYFLKNKQFVSGNKMSVADLLCICELMQLNGVHEENLYESSAVINAWVKRMKEESGPVFEEAHKKIYGVRESFVKPERK